MSEETAAQDSSDLTHPGDLQVTQEKYSDPGTIEERLSEESTETGWEQDYEIKLNRFLSLVIYRLRLDQDVYSNYVHTPPSNTFQETISLNFCVAGRFRTCLQGLAEEHWENPGFNYTEYVSGIREIELWPAEEPILRLRLVLDPRALIEIGKETPLPSALGQFVEKGTLDPFYYLEPTVPRMQWIVDQMLNCRFTGAMRRLYWEGKALELLALKVEHWSELYGDARASHLSSSNLKGDDAERIHQAREILLQNLQDPPTLIQLARQVGINDRKLKEGFRQVFGTTVFGHLHDHRMTQAQRLLLENRLSVQQVAHAVGYRSLSSFSAAFKAQFGSSPKAFLRVWHP